MDKKLKPTMGKTWTAHYLNAYNPLVAALRESQAILDYRANQGDEAAGEQFKKNAVLLKKLGGDRA